eukprot:3069928-Rhodomonas_salina.2
MAGKVTFYMVNKAAFTDEALMKDAAGLRSCQASRARRSHTLCSSVSRDARTPQRPLSSPDFLCDARVTQDLACRSTLLLSLHGLDLDLDLSLSRSLSCVLPRLTRARPASCGSEPRGAEGRLGVRSRHQGGDGVGRRAGGERRSGRGHGQGAVRQGGVAV